MGDLYNNYRMHGERRHIEGVGATTFTGDCNHNRQVAYRGPPPRVSLGGRDRANKKVGGSGSSIMTSWNDPEMKRKRRVASYKVYAVEGRVKASLGKGIRWIKVKCSELIHGGW